MKKNLRNHGLNNGCNPVGIPKATPATGKDRVAPVDDIYCPNCGCKELMQVEVAVENRMLNGGTGVGYYLGCPACPWASPMMAIAMQQKDSSEEAEA